jgi:hypothetical protein
MSEFELRVLPNQAGRKLNTYSEKKIIFYQLSYTQKITAQAKATDIRNEGYIFLATVGMGSIQLTQS